MPAGHIRRAPSLHSCATEIRPPALQAHLPDLPATFAGLDDDSVEQGSVVDVHGSMDSLPRCGLLSTISLLIRTPGR